VEAVKRGRADPLTEEAELVAATGWTPRELAEQPARSIELIRAYLEASALRREAERSRAEQQLEEQLRRIRN
jgi:hypothetical protein